MIYFAMVQLGIWIWIWEQGKELMVFRMKLNEMWVLVLKEGFVD